jgi:acyl-CoA reductase-like NAD-dependent aldehyde dehydrogenase
VDARRYVREQDWRAAARKLTFPRAMVIGGAQADAADGTTFTVDAPRDEAELTELPGSGAADVDSAVRAARAAFGPSAATPPAERKQVLHRFADALE